MRLFIHFYPIYPELRGELLRGAYRPYPAPAKLVGQNNEEGVIGPGELVFHPFQTGISEGFDTVGEQADAVAVHLRGVDIPSVLVDLDFGIFGRFLASVQGVAGVDGLIGDVVGIQVFHDVDLGVFRGGDVAVWHEPERRPEAIYTVELGLDFDAGLPERFLSAAGDAAGHERRGIVLASHLAEQDKLAVFDKDQVFPERHHVIPVALSMRNPGPDVPVQGRAVKILFPHKVPFFFCARSATSDN